MKAKKIKSITVNNGGYTDSRLEGRYIVAVKGYEKQVALGQLTTTLIGLYRHQAKLANNFIGTWVNEGVVYLDNVKGFDSLEEALKVAKSNGELAIFDSLKKVEIFL